MNAMTRLVLWGVALSISSQASFADPLSQFSWRFPNPQGNHLEAVTYGGGQFVAVGDNGTIITSPDGYHWTLRNSGSTAYLSGVAYADGEYAAVGDAGVILVSSNGVTWSQAPTATANNLNGVCGNSGWRSDFAPQFLALGAAGTGVACFNNTNWSAVAMGTSDDLYSAVWKGVAFTVAGAGGTILLYNNAGATLTQTNRVATTNDIYAVAAGPANVLAAAGNLVPSVNGYEPASTTAILYSVNSGARWTNQLWYQGVSDAPPYQTLWQFSEFFVMKGMAYGPAGFAAVGYTGYNLEYHPAVVMTSPTGTNWTELLPSISEDPLNGVAYGNGLYVAVGDFGSIVVSTDTTNWSEVLPDRRGTIAAIACNTNLCIATTYQSWYSWNFDDVAALVSTNGVNWTVARTKSQLAQISDLDCSATRFVGVSGANVLTTVDGFNWQTNSAFSNSFNGVRYLNGRFFAVGDNAAICSSGDGMIWTNCSVATPGSFSGVAYGNGVYVAAGTIWATSMDGVNWSLSTSNLPATVNRIAFGRGAFVAAGWSGLSYSPTATILESADGFSWQETLIPIGESFSSVAYNGGTFLAASAGSASLYESSDGLTWQMTAWEKPRATHGYDGYWWPSPLGLGYYPAVATLRAYNGTFLIGSSEGMIFQSANSWRPASFRLLQGVANQLTLSYTQQIDVPYRIQSSANLKNWIDIYHGAGAGQATNFVCAASNTAQFFRIASP